ncbi:four helix bundle protein [Flavobacterium sp. xlx-214]|uniref:four helix bundle protein n=1 Tax=unclassified Flavobacterium TaxID=196869 RepID=UPI0013D654D5|nr:MULTISPECIES: four helix bundle protein [unclassified Flavobacterium]MBA5793180.1 four helix bundle protein [Flavobacterium sp. xlx-221]QMI82537.1 four helix bundle protein [Flavobacterium sp. xlx-214]
MHNFEKLKIWQKAMDIAIKVYEISLILPNDEKFNLIHQIKKCAVSIPSNITEGAGRNHNKEFIQFLGIANGSTFELITQLILAKRLKLIDEETIQPIINQLVEISNMNFSFQKTLNTNQ